MVKKKNLDDNHYDPEEIKEELKSWKMTEQEYFVVGSTPEERRKPLKWKIEYETDPSRTAQMVALSR